MHENLKTLVYTKSRSFICDEKFLVPLTADQSECRDAFIKLTVKHKGILGIFNTAMSECYIKFSDILDDSVKRRYYSLWKIIPNTNNKILKILDTRREDKTVKEYFKQIQR